jgi:hypothetical protein
MLVQRVRFVLLASLMSLLPAIASAQIPGQPPEPPDSQLIDPPTDGPQPRGSRARPPRGTMRTPVAPIDPAPAPAPTRARAPRPDAAPAPSRAVTAVAPAGAPRTIACSGVFAKESTHLKLAVAFDSRNVAFTEVDSEGGKMMASVVYPNDPKRRLEVVWQNEGARADTSVIVIGGQSGWTGPKGLRLGLPLAALEKLNGKPFKLKGTDKSVAVLDWQGGALDKLSGGCKVGVHLIGDASAGDREMVSNDTELRAMKLKISEILIGY